MVTEVKRNKTAAWADIYVAGNGLCRMVGWVSAYDPMATLRSLVLSEVPNAELLCFWKRH